MFHFRQSLIIPACLAPLLCSPASFGQISFNLTSIARPGDAAPVPPQLVQVYSVSLNDSGDVAFAGDNAVLLRSNGTTTIVAALGDPAPGVGAFTYAMSPSVNAQGQVAFVATTGRPQSEGIFLSTQDGLQAIVQQGDPAPGGGMFIFFTDVSTSGNGGQLAFRASVRVGFQFRRGLFLVSGGAVRLLAYVGDPAPRGGTFRSLFSPVVNVNGQVAFYALLNPSGRGIYLSQADGTLTAVARDGDPSPAGGRFDFSLMTSSASGHRGLIHDPAFRVERASVTERGARLNSIALPKGPDGGATFLAFAAPISINDGGDVAFSASTSIPGRGGVFVFSNGILSRRIREGDPVPGGGAIIYVSAVSMNAIGQIAFQAYLSQDFVDHGFFLFSPDGTMMPIARFGERSPEGDRFTYLFSPALNAAGQVAFLSELGDSLGGAYLWSGDSIARVAGQGDPIDREPKFLSSSPLGIDGAGRVLFAADLFPGSYGLFLGNPIAVVARVGDPAPGGGVLDFVDTFWTAIIDSGQAVFTGSATSIATSYTYGVYSSSEGTLTRIAAMEDPAPGGGLFTFFPGPVSINRSGDVAFVATASLPSRSGVFLFSNPDFRSLAAYGDPAPGGGTFSSFPFLSLNDQPQVAFAAAVTAPGRPGFFRWSQDMISAIAQSGDPAPGGSTFSFPFAPNVIYPNYKPSLNNSGDVAFGAPLLSGDSGVFKFSSGEITSVARAGDTVSRAGTIIFADTASLNDAGQVSFYLDATLNIGAGFFSQGTRSAVALALDPAPGGGTFNFIDVPWLNANMQVGFLGGLPDGSGVFLANPIR